MQRRGTANPNSRQLRKLISETSVHRVCSMRKGVYWLTSDEREHGGILTAETLIHHGGLSGPIGPEISSAQLRLAEAAALCCILHFGLHVDYKCVLYCFLHALSLILIYWKWTFPLSSLKSVVFMRSLVQFSAGKPDIPSRIFLPFSQFLCSNNDIITLNMRLTLLSTINSWITVTNTMWCYIYRWGIHWLVNDVNLFEALSRSLHRQISATAVSRVNLRADNHYYPNIRHYIASPVDRASTNNLK